MRCKQSRNLRHPSRPLSNCLPLSRDLTRAGAASRVRNRRAGAFRSGTPGAMPRPPSAAGPSTRDHRQGGGGGRRGEVHRRGTWHGEHDDGAGVRRVPARFRVCLRPNLATGKLRRRARDRGRRASGRRRGGAGRTGESGDPCPAHHDAGRTRSRAAHRDHVDQVPRSQQARRPAGSAIRTAVRTGRRSGAARSRAGAAARSGPGAGFAAGAAVLVGETPAPVEGTAMRRPPQQASTASARPRPTGRRGHSRPTPARRTGSGGKSGTVPVGGTSRPGGPVPEPALASQPVPDAVPVFATAPALVPSRATVPYCSWPGASRVAEP
ncbi:conserved hypothetical protein [Streptomyces sp. SPB074]|nr:conserved hypothetical protein [Streptomyces sp. SPB074]